MKKKSLSTAVWIASLLCSLVFVSIRFVNVTKASTIVNSLIITSDTTWTKANSPYALTGPVAVANGATLVIEPGVTVNLGTYYLQVNGTLRAIGSSTDKIIFSSTETRNDLYQIVFTKQSTSWNEQTGAGGIIENAIVNASISVTGVSPKINNNHITDPSISMINSNVGIYIDGGSPVVTNNYFIGGVDVSGEGSPLISNNVIGGGMGIYGGTPQVLNNEIAGGSSYFWIGRSFERDYDVVVIGSCSPLISGNKITGNTLGIGFFENSHPSAIISNNIIHDCGGGISLSGTDSNSVTIQGNLITNTGDGIDATDDLRNPIQGNLITNSSVGIRISPNVQVTIQRNTLANNSIGISTCSSFAIISNNNIQSLNYTLQMAQGASKGINATDNWWGTTDTAAISESIFDNKNDFNLGKVNFTPYLTAPTPEAPAITMIPSPTSPSGSSPTASSSPSPSPDSNSSSTPPSSPAPTDSSTPSEPANQSGNQVTPELPIQEIVIISLVAVVVGLLIVIAWMHKKNQPQKQKHNPTA